MNEITKEQYEFALAKIEELLPLVDDNTPSRRKTHLLEGKNHRKTHLFQG